MNKIKNNVNNNKNKKNKNNNNKSSKQPTYNEGKLVGVKLAKSVVKKPVIRSSPSVRMSHCAAKYALAVTDPLNPATRGACVPYGSAPTMKVTAFTRFDLTIGTGGLAFMYIAPCLANDSPSVYYTTGSYTGTTATANQPWATAGNSTTAATFTTGWTTAAHNGPFTTAQVTNPTSNDNPSNVQGRIVAAGLRCQYTGTTLNESGLFYGYHDPSHTSLSGISAAIVGSFGDTNIKGINRRPNTLSVFGISEEEMTIKLADPGGTSGVALDLYPYSNGNVTWETVFGGSTTEIAPYTLPASYGGSTYYVLSGVPVGVVAITGVAGQTVHVEYSSHLEFVGVGAASMLTPVHADVEGTQVVRTAALQLPSMVISQPEKSTWELMYSALGHVLEAAKPMAIPLLERAVTAMLL
jgi:hypothetical protein